MFPISDRHYYRFLCRTITDVMIYLFAFHSILDTDMMASVEIRYSGDESTALIWCHEPVVLVWSRSHELADLTWFQSYEPADIKIVSEPRTDRSYMVSEPWTGWSYLVSAATDRSPVISEADDGLEPSHRTTWVWLGLSKCTQLAQR